MEFLLKLMWIIASYLWYVIVSVMWFMFSYYTGLRFNWSSNVFVENLHNTRDLETLFYATAANEQQFDFWWVRESNVKVNIGLEKINIFPKYVDVDHKSDNNYMTPHTDTVWFNEIRSKHCRFALWLKSILSCSNEYILFNNLIILLCTLPVYYYRNGLYYYTICIICYLLYKFWIIKKAHLLFYGYVYIYMSYVMYFTFAKTIFSSEF